LATVHPIADELHQVLGGNHISGPDHSKDLANLSAGILNTDSREYPFQMLLMHLQHPLSGYEILWDD